MDLSQCIFPIYNGGTIIGQGFIADGFFITAAHVVKNYPSCFFNLNGQRIELDKKAPINFIDDVDYHHDSQMEDVVMFQFKGTNSPLHLSEYIPQKVDKLASHCMREVIDLNSINPSSSYELSIIPAYPLEKEEGNYFYCECNRFAASSGSPLLKGNEVVGIMHGGDDKGICAFLKMGSVLYNIGDFYFHYVYDPLDHLNVFHAIPTPDYKEAFRWYMKAAANNYPQAVYQIAYCYERGKGVDKNWEEAIVWYTKSASQEHVESQFALGNHFFNGEIVSQNYAKATYWFRLAAEQQHTMSLYKLGLCSYLGLGFVKSYHYAEKWFHLAVEGWEAYKEYAPPELRLAYYYLGLCCLNDKTSALPPYFAVYYFQKAGNLNEALYYLGICHKNGWGVPNDYKQAFLFFKKASNIYGEFTHKADYEVGMCYYKGKGVNQDYKEAVRWFKKAYDCDDAIFQLGVCYYRGQGVEGCYEEALSHFYKLAIKGNIRAQRFVGELQRRLGEFQKKKYRIERAIEWYKKLLSQGYTDSLWSIGYCFETMGNIGYHDKFDEAIHWYKMAWTQGDLEAIGDINNCFEAIFNLGYIDKCKEAIIFFKQAWEHGIIEANRYIGNCYKAMFNMGDKEKIKDAIIWYKKAAAFNDDRACRSLSIIYKNGIGVPVNEQEAKKWIELADKYNPISKILSDQRKKEDGESNLHTK